MSNSDTVHGATLLLISGRRAHALTAFAAYLRGAGYNVVLTRTVAEGEQILERQEVNLVLLGVDHDDMSGAEACRRLRHGKSACAPIIALSAHDSEIDRIVAFELGVTDFVVLPCHEREVLLRVKAILRRQTSTSSRERLTWGPVTIDVPRHRVCVFDREVQLRPREYALLCHLVAAQGRVLSRQDLLTRIWGDQSGVVGRVVDVCVMRLRRKLGEASPHLQTVRGFGYRFGEAGPVCSLSV